MSDETLQMKPWQVFQAARKHLGAERVARIFNRETRSAHNWAQDPIYTQCRCKTPLETLRNLFAEMDTMGLGYVVRSAIEYLGTSLDPAGGVGEIKETLPTIQEEILADYTSVAALQQAIASGVSVDVVRSFGRAATEEIERTVAKYAQGKKGGDQ